MNSPLLDFLSEALNLVHPRFALAYGSEYAPGDVTAARRERERPFLCEFFHQIRHLWERGLPGRLGLGHIVLQDEPGHEGLRPDLLFWRLGEQGQPNRRLGAVSLAFATNPDAIRANESLLARFMQELGYPEAIHILAGDFTSSADRPAFEGVTHLRYDTKRRQTLTPR